MDGLDELRLASAYVDSRRWQRGLEVLGSFLARSPDDPRALCLVAHCHLGLGNADLALAAANAAAAAVPLDPWAARLQSAALRSARRWRDARAAADRAIRLAPGDVTTHIERATVDAAAGRPTRAGVAAAREAVRMAPNSPAAHVASGQVWLVQRRPQRAEAAFHEAMRLDPVNVPAQHGLVRVAQRFGGLRRAARLLVGIIRLDPSDQRYVTELSDVLTVALVFPGLAGVVVTLLVAPVGAVTVPRLHLAVALIACLLAQGLAVVLLRRAVGPALVPLLFSPRPEQRWRTWMLRVACAAFVVCDLALLVGIVVTGISLTAVHVAGVATMAAALCLVLSRIRRTR